MEVLVLGLLYVLVNLPFGYLRAGVPKKTPKWFLYIHLPIPILVCLRLFVFKVSWRWIPLLVLCYALGQWSGGKWRSSKRSGALVGALLLIGIGGFLVGSSSFSEHSPSVPPPAPVSSPSLPNASFKIGGVVKAIDVSNPPDFHLTLVSESQTEKKVFFSSETPIVFEGIPLPPADLKPGDVLDVDCVFDATTQKTVIHKATVIVRAASDQTVQEPDLSKDPEFE